MVRRKAGIIRATKSYASYFDQLVLKSFLVHTNSVNLFFIVDIYSCGFLDFNLEPPGINYRLSLSMNERREYFTALNRPALYCRLNKTFTEISPSKFNLLFCILLSSSELIALP